MALGWINNIEKLTTENETFRTVLFTGKYSQLTVMSVQPGDSIGNEVHDDHDQFLRIESGSARVELSEAGTSPDESHEVGDGFAVVVPAGTWHNVINTGDDVLKLYSLYAPAEHPAGTVHMTKAEADAAEAEHAS